MKKLIEKHGEDKAKWERELENKVDERRHEIEIHYNGRLRAAKEAITREYEETFEVERRRHRQKLEEQLELHEQHLQKERRRHAEEMESLRDAHKRTRDEDMFLAEEKIKDAKAAERNVLEEKLAALTQKFVALTEKFGALEEEHNTDVREREQIIQAATEAVRAEVSAELRSQFEEEQRREKKRLQEEQQGEIQKVIEQLSEEHVAMKDQLRDELRQKTAQSLEESDKRISVLTVKLDQAQTELEKLQNSVEELEEARGVDRVLLVDKDAEFSRLQEQVELEQGRRVTAEAQLDGIRYELEGEKERLIQERDALEASQHEAIRQLKEDQDNHVEALEGKIKKTLKSKDDQIRKLKEETSLATKKAEKYKREADRNHKELLDSLRE
eukprot:GHVU01047749.1.p1 GENE.GHVU01047749.1~~GHVU01047749.1.p1  ORF type:complete len:386 (+),score=132.89 GHVU01047749.1:282-1439(+)